MSTPLRILLLSNGHGEDAVGARLGAEVEHRLPKAELLAFPTVGRGEAYGALKIPILGPRQAMPSGGLTLHSPMLLWQDLRAGWLPMTCRQLATLRALQTDLLIVVGDVYALLLSGLVRAERRYYVQTLVSVLHSEAEGGKDVIPLHRRFMERFTVPELYLIRRLATHTYLRDEATATHLRARGIEAVSALGNPALDIPYPRPLFTVPAPPVVALLPGTRTYAAASLRRMLEALACWPQATGMVAWAASEAPPEASGWQWRAGLEISSEIGGEARGLLGGYTRGQQHVPLFRNRFADVLGSAQLVLGTAGTAHEQAAALGLPVVAFEVPPHYTRAFLRNQRRLLSHALTLAPPRPEAIAGALRELWDDPSRYRRAVQTGPARMGRRGGSRNIVCDILRHEGEVCSSR